MMTDIQMDWQKKRTHRCESNCHYAYAKCLTLKSTFVIQLFIATSIMASTSPDPSVNILNDHINVHQPFVDFVTEKRPESIEEQILLNEQRPLLSSKKLNNKGHSWSMALSSSSTVRKDKSKYPLSSNNNPCVCTNRKSSCLRMCDHAQQHIPKRQQHNRCINRMCKHKQNAEIGRVHAEPDLMKSSTLIFGNTVIKNGVQSISKMARNQSIGTHAGKVHVKPHNNHTTHSQLNVNRTFHNRNAHGINKSSRIHASFHSHKINNHSENAQIMNAKRNNRIDANKTLQMNEEKINNVEQTVNNVKRTTRSVTDPMQSERHDVNDALNWQVSRKNANRIETTVNESIGSTFGGNGITDFTVSS